MDGVHCQRFGQDSTLQRLFEVVPPVASNDAQDQDQDRGGGEDRAKRDQEAV